MRIVKKYLILVIIPIILFAIVLSVVDYVLEVEHLIKIATEDAKRLAKITAHEMRNPMYALDVDKLNEIIDSVEETKQVHQVTVLFPDGRILTDGSDGGIYGHGAYGDFQNKAIISDNIESNRNGNTVQISAPIILNDKIGIVLITYSFEHMYDIIEQSVFNNILIASVLILIFIPVSIITSKKITDPIYKIRERIQSIPEGKFKPLEKRFNEPELQELYDGIESMYKKIQEYQREIISSERLATIGEFSARIAHDLRNPLSVIKNSADIIKTKNPVLVRENLKYFDMMDSSINRINSEVTDILEHVKTRKPSKIQVSFKEILDEVISQMDVPSNIKISRPKEDQVIWCDPYQIKNVLNNLIQNSIHAIEKNEGNIVVDILEDGIYQKITVSDDGTGIPKENIDRIFEPLFTTKSFGTGLGLVNSRNIISSHNGKIFAENLTKGAMFTILLPKKENQDM